MAVFVLDLGDIQYIVRTLIVTFLHSLGLVELGATNRHLLTRYSLHNVSSFIHGWYGQPRQPYMDSLVEV